MVPMVAVRTHPRMARRIGTVLVAWLVWLCARGDTWGQDIERGRAIYNYRCYVCHGYAGNARTLAAEFLHPKPRDFTGLLPAASSRDAMIATVTAGTPGTAMKPFAGVLTPQEIASVVDFIRTEFMERRRANTRYHTAANGWPDHERYAAAFPFATGDIALDTPPEALTSTQRAGRRLFVSSCIACHDRARVDDRTVVWERQALSYPRFGANPAEPRPHPDAITGATTFATHERPPQIAGLTALERQGEALYQSNCAFCHGADGTGKNWIGRFLNPHPRDLTDPAAMAGMTRSRLRRVIREGLASTSMPAWGHVLDAAQIESVIAYIARAFHPLAAEPLRERPPR